MDNFCKYIKFAFSIGLGVSIGLSLFVADTTTVIYAGLVMLLFIALFPQN